MLPQHLWENDLNGCLGGRTEVGTQWVVARVLGVIGHNGG